MDCSAPRLPNPSPPPGVCSDSVTPKPSSRTLKAENPSQFTERHHEVLGEPSWHRPRLPALLGLPILASPSPLPGRTSELSRASRKVLGDLPRVLWEASTVCLDLQEQVCWVHSVLLRLGCSQLGPTGSAPHETSWLAAVFCVFSLSLRLRRLLRSVVSGCLSLHVASVIHASASTHQRFCLYWAVSATMQTHPTLSRLNPPPCHAQFLASQPVPLRPTQGRLGADCCPSPGL